MISLKPPNQQTLQDEPIKETIVNDPFVMKNTEFNSYGVIKTLALRGFSEYNITQSKLQLQNA